MAEAQTEISAPRAEQSEREGTFSETYEFLKTVKAMSAWNIIKFNNGVNAQNYSIRDNTALREWREERIANKENAYWGINTYLPGTRKAEMEEVATVDRLHADIDLPKFKGPGKTNPYSHEEQDAMRAHILRTLQDAAALKAAGLPGLPTFIIDSGSGYWGFWDLEDPLALTERDPDARREEAHNLSGHNKWLGDRLNVALGHNWVDGCYNIDRVSRLPGTLNIPDELKRQANRRVAWTHALFSPGQLLYRTEQFGWANPGPCPPSRRKVTAHVITAGAALPVGDDADQLIYGAGGLAERHPKVGTETWSKVLNAANIFDPTNNGGDTSTSGYLWQVLRAFAWSGVPSGEALEITLDERFPISTHNRMPKDGKTGKRIQLNARDARAHAERQVKKAYAKVAEERAKQEAALAAQAAAETALAPAPAAEAPAIGAGSNVITPPAFQPRVIKSEMTPIEAMEFMNRNHAVLLQEGNQTVVLSWSKSELGRMVPILQSFKTFQQRYSNRYVSVVKKGGIESVPLGKWWLDHPARRQYLALRFDPQRSDVCIDYDDELGVGYHNMWRGFSVEAQAGDWSLMRDHLRNVLAAGDEASFDYIYRWAAWTLQNPHRPAEVALVFQGGRGVGKGIFARWFANLFGQHGLHISSPEHLVGKFNSHLRDCCVLFADEVFATADKVTEGKLKSLITEPTFTVEGKGRDAVVGVNRLHVIMASNEDWVVPAGADERRFAIFPASDAHRGQFAYFSAIEAQMKAGGAAAMLHELRTFDLQDWHPRKGVPETSALHEQKMHSISGVEKLWFEILQTGELPVGEHEKIADEGRDFADRPFVPTGQIEEFAIRRLNHKVAPQRIAILFKKFNAALEKYPDAQDRLNLYRQKGGGTAAFSRRRGWLLPPLPLARALWDAVMFRYDWEACDGTDWVSRHEGASEAYQRRSEGGYVDRKAAELALAGGFTH